MARSPVPYNNVYDLKVIINQDNFIQEFKVPYDKSFIDECVGFSHDFIFAQYDGYENKLTFEKYIHFVINKYLQVNNILTNENVSEKIKHKFEEIKNNIIKELNHLLEILI